MYWLWAISVGKLIFVFSQSIYAISKKTIVLLVILFVIEPIIIIIVVIISLMTHIPQTVVTFGFLYSISFSLVVTGLFVYKLKKVYDSTATANKSKNLIKVMTNLSILCILSISCTVISLLSFLIMDAMNGDLYFVILRDYAVLFDEFTNVICVMMSFNFYQKGYRVLCGSCHLRLEQLLSAPENDTSKMVERVDSASAPVQAIVLDSNDAVEASDL